jgi:hypothetical protein
MEKRGRIFTSTIDHMAAKCRPLAARIRLAPDLINLVYSYILYIHNLEPLFCGCSCVLHVRMSNPASSFKAMRNANLCSICTV